MKDFFISYNKADLAWAEWIAWELEDHGYTTIIQAWDFRPGSNFVIEMQSGSSEAERTIAILSPEYLSSSFTQPEWAAAFAQDPTGKKGLLLPIRVKECELEGLLPQIVYIDLFGLQEHTGKERLLAGVNRDRAKPKIKPKFPQQNNQKVQSKPGFPSAMPLIWNIPLFRNPNFTGRNKILDELHTTLTSGHATTLTQSLHGLGGIGKTQISVEYAYRHSGSYKVIWWLRAEEPASLFADYAALANFLNLQEKDDQDQSVTVSAVRNWLESNQGWLLIFDNAREPAEVRNYIPRNITGHIIITSRNPNWLGTAKPLQVKILERYESLALLQKQIVKVDDDAADTLANILGDLPLAMAQAAAYMESTGIDIQDYLKLFLTRREALWSQEKNPVDYPDSVSTTWSVAMDKVRSEFLTAADLLNLLAFFSPNELPRNFVSDAHKLLPSPLAETAGDSLELNRAVVLLRRYALIEATGEYFQVHRLVQAVTQDRLAPDERRSWVETAVNLLFKIFPSDSYDPDMLRICSLLIPHVLVVTGHAEILNCATKKVGYLLNRLGVYLCNRMQFAEARIILERSLAITEKESGLEAKEVVNCLANLSAALNYLKDHTGARTACERALKISESTFGPDNPKTAFVLNNLGNILRDSGDPNGALKILERALKIDEKTYGPDHSTVSIRLNNIGSVLLILGKDKTARKYFERSLEIDEKACGPDHPVIAIRVNNLGSVLLKIGDYAGARTYFERALNILRACYGDDYPRVKELMLKLKSLRVSEQFNSKRMVTLQPAHSEKVGRNLPCPCGSNKKFKKCCGR